MHAWRNWQALNMNFEHPTILAPRVVWNVHEAEVTQFRRRRLGALGRSGSACAGRWPDWIVEITTHWVGTGRLYLEAHVLITGVHREGDGPSTLRLDLIAHRYDEAVAANL